VRVARGHEGIRCATGAHRRALEDASKRLTADCKAGREKTLEDLALKRAPAAAARAVLETLAWADGALYHAWRLAESLRIASGR
jgi:phosphate:Na+ symporter